jgi:hypothetical protein
MFGMEYRREEYLGLVVVGGEHDVNAQELGHHRSSLALRVAIQVEMRGESASRACLPCQEFSVSPGPVNLRCTPPLVVFEERVRQ